MKLTYKTLVAGSLMTVSAAAMALPVTGGMSFTANSEDFKFDDQSITFGTAPEGEENGRVGQRSKDFANYFAFNDFVAFEDFEYSPFTTGPQLVWSGTGSLDPTFMAFYLDNITSSDYTGKTLEISGTGFLTDALLSDDNDSVVLLSDALFSESPTGNTTEMNWVFTANNFGDNNFSWSASTAVPEPGTLALLGLGLAGLGAARRRQKAA